MPRKRDSTGSAAGGDASTTTATPSSSSSKRRRSTSSGGTSRRSSSGSASKATAAAPATTSTTPVAATTTTTTVPPPSRILIIDTGGDTVQFDWLDTSSASGSPPKRPRSIPNVTARLPQQWTVLVGDQLRQIQNPGQLINVTRSMERGVIVNWGNQIQVWKRVLDLLGVAVPLQNSATAHAFGWKKNTTTPTQIPASTCAVLLTVPPFCPRSVLDHTLVVWMEDLGVAHVGLVTGPVASARHQLLLSSSSTSSPEEREQPTPTPSPNQENNNNKNKIEDPPLPITSTTTKHNSPLPWGTCCVVDVGWSAVHIVPVTIVQEDSKKKTSPKIPRSCLQIHQSAVRRVPVGGRQLVNIWKFHASYRQWNLMDQEYVVLQPLWEQAAYLSRNYQQQMYHDSQNYPRGQRPYDREYVLPDYQRTMEGTLRIPPALQRRLDEEEKARKQLQQQKAGSNNQHHQNAGDSDDEFGEDDDDEDVREEDMMEEDIGEDEMDKDDTGVEMVAEDDDDDDEDEEVGGGRARGKRKSKQQSKKKKKETTKNKSKKKKKSSKAKVADNEEDNIHNNEDEEGDDDDMDSEEEEDPEALRVRLLKERQEEERRRRALEAEQQQVLQVSVERFAIPEALFRPTDVGLPASWAGLHHAVNQAIQASPPYCRAGMYRSIRLTGGLSQLPHLMERLEEEVRALAPDCYHVALEGVVDPLYQTWYGAYGVARDFPYTEWSLSRDQWEAADTKKGAWKLLAEKPNVFLI